MRYDLGTTNESLEIYRCGTTTYEIEHFLTKPLMLLTHNALTECQEIFS